MTIQPGECAWDWPEICCVLVWKLAPEGVVVNMADLVALPMERVLFYERLPGRIDFQWLTIKQARKVRDVTARLATTPDMKTSVEQVQGRWMKLASTLLWKLARDGVVLTEQDREKVPTDKVLLAHGHKEDIEYRFVPRAEAARIQKWEKEHEGLEVLEVVR